MRIKLEMDFEHKLRGGTCPVLATVLPEKLDQSGTPVRSHVLNASPAWWRRKGNRKLVAVAFFSGMKMIDNATARLLRDSMVAW